MTQPQPQQPDRTLSTPYSPSTLYRPLALPPDQQPDEPGEYYAARLVCWLLQPDHHTVTLSDAQLERAQYGLTDALSHRSVLQQESTPACVYDRLEALRRDLQATIVRRATLVSTDQTIALQTDSQPAGRGGVDDHRDGGTRVPVHPTAPRFPPAGQARPIVEIRF